MNPIESFAITMILGVLNQAIKNPASKAAMSEQLLGLASDIAITYGYTLQPPATLATQPGNPNPAAFVPGGATRPISS